VSTTLNPTICLHPIQVDFLNCEKTFASFCGGIGSGKTFILCYDLLKRVRRGRLYMVCAPSYPMLRDVTIRSFFDLTRKLGIQTAYNKSEHRVTLQRSGAEILFRSADNPEMLRGPNLSGVWIDEASLMGDDVYKILIGRLRQGSEIGTLRACFTPKGPSHWTFRTFNTSQPDTAIFRCATDANPFLPPDFHDKVKLQYGVGQFARQELAGEFVQMEGAEWPWELLEQEGRWFKDWPTDIWQWVIALDPSKGISDHPTVQGANRGKVGDWQAYVIIGIDRYNTFWIDADMARRSVIDMVRRGLDLCKMFKPTPTLVVEDNDILGLLLNEFMRQIRENDLAIPLIPIRNSINKEVRLRRLGGYFAQRHEKYGLQMRFRETEGMRILMGQAADFPLSEFDDGIDCLEVGMHHIEDLLNPG
jgi:phage terminase large subunit-like protein